MSVRALISIAPSLSPGITSATHWLYASWVALLALCTPAHAQGAPPGIDLRRRVVIAARAADLEPSEVSCLRDALALERVRRRIDSSDFSQDAADAQARLRSSLVDHVHAQKLDRLDWGVLLGGTRRSPLSAEASVSAHVPTGLQGGGSVASWRAQTQLSARFPLTGSVFGFANAQAGFTRYDLEDAATLDPVGGDPIESSSDVNLQGGVLWRLSPRWQLMVSGSLSSSGEDRVEDGVTGGGLAAISAKLNEFVTLGLLALGRTQLEAEPTLLALPLVELRLPLWDTLELQFGTRSGVGLSYFPTASLELRCGVTLAGAVGTADTRLSRANELSPRGILRRQSVPLLFTLQWTPTAWRLQLRLSAGAIVYQRLEIDDERGKSVTDDRSDPAAFFELGLRWTF